MISSSTIPGRADQDVCFEIKREHYVFFGICDGNGLNGKYVATICSEFLKNRFDEIIKTCSKMDVEVIKEMFHACDDNICSDNSKMSSKSGTTVNACIFNKKTDEAYMINVGDSRSIISVENEIKYLSKPHLSSDHYISKHSQVTKVTSNVFKITWDESLKTTCVVADAEHGGVLYTYDAECNGVRERYHHRLTPTSIMGHSLLKANTPLTLDVDVDIISVPSIKSTVIMCASDGFWDVFPQPEKELIGAFAETAGRLDKKNKNNSHTQDETNRRNNRSNHSYESKYYSNNYSQDTTLTDKNHNNNCQNGSSLADTFATFARNKWDQNWIVRLSNGYVYPGKHLIPTSEIDDIAVTAFELSQHHDDTL